MNFSSIFCHFYIIGLLLPLVNANFVVNNVVTSDYHLLHVIFIMHFQVIAFTAMSSYLNPKWFRLGKKHVDIPDKGEYMFPKEHLEIHIEYNGAFLGEVILGLVLGSPGTQHTSDPHGFEVWPKEGCLEKQ